MTSLEYFQEHCQEYLGELESLVRLESPSGDLEHLSRAAAFVGDLLSPLGTLAVDRLEGLGPLLHLRRAGRGARVLLLAHLDTIWPVGSWEDPWRVDGGRARGPGVYDMKGGLLFIPWLLRCLEATGRGGPELEVLVNPDEEVGSPGSRAAILAAAARSDAVLVLEPCDLDGSLKLARKGSGEFVITVRGRSAHQGAEPELGVNAVVEAAHQVLAMTALDDPVTGTSVGPNVLTGGSVSNMVADIAEVRVDVRAWTAAEQHRLEAQLRSLRPVLTGAEVSVTGRWNRPPLEATPASIALFERARRLGDDLQMDLRWRRWGGSSDANIAGAACAAVLDGLGPVGRAAHQREECIEIDPLPRRLALITELVASLVGPPAALG